MNSTLVVFQQIISKIESVNIPYMIVGSVATIVYGEIRMTKDMDIVINVTPQDALVFEKLFPQPDYYCPPKEVLIDECTSRGQFNLIHVSSGLKVDVIIQKANPHSQMEFSRKKRISILDTFDATIAAPEDVIIKKLQYYDEGRSTKHLQDIRGVLAQTPVDEAYLKDWIDKLHLNEFWKLV